MIETTVTRKFQITIPKVIREKLKIKVGDRLLISIQDDKIILKPIREHETLAKLARINVNAAYEAVNQYLNLSIKLLDPNRETFIYAKEIAIHSKTTYDSIHAALIAQNKIHTIITEDLKTCAKYSQHGLN